MAHDIADPILESLQNDMAQVGEQLKAIAQKVVEEGITEYPVFVAAQQIVDIGKPIFDRDVVHLNWFFSASIIEEFIHKEIVKKENLTRFRKTLGDPVEKACIFVITEEEARFVFVPYGIEGANNDIDEI